MLKSPKSIFLEKFMNLYSFNKLSWFAGYDNKGQHFEKWRSATASYDNKT